jgi:hypothetical protein
MTHADQCRARRLVLVASLVAASGAFAQSHPLTLRMSCPQARDLVAVQGAVVLNTGPTTYDRYVSSSNACILGERVEPAWVPTGDTPQCFIGYRCVTRPTSSRS